MEEGLMHGSMSQMAEKCQKCSDRDKCDNKRMEMCAYIKMPEINISIGAMPTKINLSLDNILDKLKIVNDEVEKIGLQKCKSRFRL